MPKLSATPKLYAHVPPGLAMPVLLISAASEAEAWAYLRSQPEAMERLTPAEAYGFGACGIPMAFAKPEYRNDRQDELPLSGSEVAHGQP